MDKFIDWLIHSSTDADKISAFIKGLTVFVPSIMVFLALTRIQLSDGAIIQLIEELAMLVSILGTLGGAVATLLGGFRKIFTTVAGTNAVLEKYK